MAAPYNPETLNRIRAGACALDLGWDEPFYHSVCRRHGIEAIASPSAGAAPRCDAPDVPDAPVLPVVPIDGSITVVDHENGEVRRGSSCIQLTAKQLRFVGAIVASPGVFVRTERIAALAGIGVSSISNYAAPVRKAMNALSIYLDARMGKHSGGGYRFIDSRTRVPIKFKQIGWTR